MSRSQFDPFLGLPDAVREEYRRTLTWRRRLMEILFAAALFGGMMLFIYLTDPDQQIF